MKAAVCERYGPPEVVRIHDVPKPVPRDDEVLIRIRATTVNSGDARIRALRVPAGTSLPARMALGFFRPRKPVLGFDLAGDVEAVGPAVSRFKPGDRVLGYAGFGFGCHAEFRCLAEGGAMTMLPDGIGYETAVALVFGGGTAMDFLRRGALAKDGRLLINGASGAVGVAAVQLAKLMGAHVTGVCSAANADLVRSLGADAVIDYAAEDFATAGERYDVIMDTVGNAPYRRVRRALQPGGRFLMVVGTLIEEIQGNFQRDVVGSAAKETDVYDSKVLDELLALFKDGKIRPVIGRTYPFDEIVEAHRHVDSGRKRGSVVVTLD